MPIVNEYGIQKETDAEKRERFANIMFNEAGISSEFIGVCQTLFNMCMQMENEAEEISMYTIQQMHLSFASDNWLDMLASNYAPGLSRKAGNKTQIYFKCNCLKAGTIGKNQTKNTIDGYAYVEATDSNGNKYVPIANTTISSAGYQNILFEAVDYGEIKPSAKGTVSLVNDNNIIADITNETEPILEGSIGETDAQFRKRIENFSSGSGSMYSVESDLNNIDGVIDSKVYQNPEDVDNETTGLPAHSFLAIVNGGAPMDIAKVLVKHVGITTKMLGSQEVEYVEDNIAQLARYEVPTNINIYAKAYIKLASGNYNDLSEETKASLKTKIQTYANNDKEFSGICKTIYATQFQNFVESALSDVGVNGYVFFPAISKTEEAIDQDFLTFESLKDKFVLLSTTITLLDYSEHN